MIVYLYRPWLQHHGNKEEHWRMIRAEDRARADGYKVQSYEPNGFVTGIEFKTKDEGIAFIFKYLRNHSP